MKALFFVVALTATLIALPAIAQQGPAGVPGAPGLAPPPPPAPVVVAPPPEPVVASPKAPPAKCGKSGTKSCKPKKAAAPSCSSSSDPARCEQHRKAKEQCKNLPDRDYRQCLRDNLTVKK